jgi:hypothetical protein
VLSYIPPYTFYIVSYSLPPTFDNFAPCLDCWLRNPARFAPPPTVGSGYDANDIESRDTTELHAELEDTRRKVQELQSQLEVEKKEVRKRRRSSGMYTGCGKVPTMR